MRVHEIDNAGSGQDAGDDAAADNKRLLLENLKRTRLIMDSASRNDLAEALFILALEVSHYRAGNGHRYEACTDVLSTGKLLDNAQTTWVNNALHSISAILAILADPDASRAVH